MEERAARMWYEKLGKRILEGNLYTLKRNRFRKHKKTGKDAAWSDREICRNVPKPEGVSKDVNPGKKGNDSLSFPRSRTASSPSLVHTRRVHSDYSQQQMTEGPHGASRVVKVEKKQKENLLENCEEIQKPEIGGLKKY